MSSEDDIDLENNSGAHNADDKNKKRRVQRACDTCRKKKIRCDGSQMVDNRCTNCITWNMECTYVEAAKKRGPPKGYVESLENRLEKMEKLLRSLCPDADFTKELGTFIDRETWYHERSSKHSNGGSNSTPQNMPQREIPPVGGIRATPSSKTANIADQDIPSSDEEGLVHATLAEGLKHLTVNVHDRRFHGKSSGFMLVQAAMDFKREYAGRADLIGANISDSRREEFWTPLDWESATFDPAKASIEFPPQDLVRSLFDLFFEHSNPFIPVQHRPSLERHYAEGLHNTCKPFAASVLLTCAVAARWSDDPRCYLEDQTKHSAGWKWFEQAHVLRRNTLAAPTLYDVQVYALSAIFLQGSSAPQAAWTMVGIGIRLAQDVGAHRRKIYNSSSSTTVEDELWKRVFWTLVALDRTTSSALGRPCAVQDEDFDLDHPLEVDDEFWEHPDPTQAFKQLADRPAQVAFFNSFLKLNQILAFALRTIYSINKSKILLGFVGPQWEQHIVAELDSALNKWIDSVPDHLRWDPNREDTLFFAQSATLYATYYHFQILIHRPFIPTPRKRSPLQFPSLAICTNAARSCSHVLDVLRRRMRSLVPTNMSAAFTSGIVLLLNIWGAKKSGVQSDPLKQMQDVHKCMQYLKDVETRFRSAGRLWDILYELASVGELPLPQPSPPGQSRKRERDSDNLISSSRSSTSTSSEQPLIGASRLVAKPKTTASRSTSGSTPSTLNTQPTQSVHSNQTPTPPLHTPSAFSHPVTSFDLGRMPLNPEVYQNPAPQHDPIGSLGWYGLQPPQAIPNTGYAPGAPQQSSHPYVGQTAQPDAYMYPMQTTAPDISYTDPYVTQAQQGALDIGAVQRQHGYGAGEPHGGHDDYVGGMWSGAPASFEYDDWGNWVSNGIDPNTGMLTGIPPDQNMHHDPQQ